jgi:hypothetical protein
MIFILEILIEHMNIMRINIEFLMKFNFYVGDYILIVLLGDIK